MIAVQELLHYSLPVWEVSGTIFPLAQADSLSSKVSKVCYESFLVCHDFMPSFTMELSI